jgi:hypothetical protein
MVEMVRTLACEPVPSTKTIPLTVQLTHAFLESFDMFRLDLRHSGRVVALAIAGLLLSSSPEAFAADANDSDESWQVIHLAGKRIGYGRVVIRKVSRERDTIFITDAE